MGIGRNVSRSIGRDVVRDIGFGDGVTPPPPSGKPIIWDGQLTSPNAPTLNAEKTIMSVVNLPAGGANAGVESLTKLPDTNQRIYCIKYLGFAAPAGNDNLLAVNILANNLFDFDNLFATVFGNTFLAGAAMEVNNASQIMLGNVGSFLDVIPPSPVTSTDILTFIIDGTDWLFFRNSVRQNSGKIYGGGNFAANFDRVIGGFANNGAVPLSGSMEIISLNTDIEALPISRAHWPVGSQDYAGNPISVGAGTKTAWGNPLFGTGDLIYKSRISNDEKTMDFRVGVPSLQSPDSQILAGVSTPYAAASAFTGWVVQEVLLSTVETGTYKFKYQWASPDTSTTSEIYFEYTSNAGETLVGGDIDSGDGAGIVPTIAVNDRIAIALKPSTGEWQIFYKPAAGLQVVVDSGTLITQFVTNRQWTSVIAAGLFPETTSRGWIVDLMQDSSDMILDYSSLVGGVETINGEAV